MGYSSPLCATVIDGFFVYSHHSKNMFEIANDMDYLTNVIIAYETWSYCYDIVFKQETSQWVPQGSSHRLKVRPYYAAQHSVAKRGKATQQKLISMGSKNAVYASVSTLQVAFLGNFTKNGLMKGCTCSVRCNYRFMWRSFGRFT